MSEFADFLSPCNVYTFKLTISNGCEKSISTGKFKQITKHCNYYYLLALTPKPDNVSAMYHANKTLMIIFQVSRYLILYTRIKALRDPMKINYNSGIFITFS